MNLDGIRDYMDYMKEYPQFLKDLLGFPLFWRDRSKKIPRMPPRVWFLPRQIRESDWTLICQELNYEAGLFMRKIKDRAWMVGFSGFFGALLW